MKIFRYLLLLCVLLLSVQNSYSSHIMGGEITWECLSNGQYKFYFSIYRDCSGLDISPSGRLEIHNYPVVGQKTSLSYSFINGNSNGNDLSPDCYFGQAFNCNGSPGDPRAVNEFLLQTPAITLNGVPPPQGWIITYTESARNSNDNISGTPGITLRAKILAHSGSVPGQCIDNSPTFREKPTSLVCTGAPFTYNHNASDEELDSLVYEWAKPLGSLFFNDVFIEGSQPSAVPYQPGFTYNNPFPSPGNNHPNNVAATLDPSTGEISLTSYDDGKYVSVVKVTAYKCGEPVAEIYRELQSNFTNTCQAGNTKPVISPPFPLIGAPTTFSDTFQAGDFISFNIVALDTGNNFNPNGLPQNVELEVSGLQLGANYTDPTSGCPNPPCATLTPPPPSSSPLASQMTFNWQTACNHVAYNDGCVSLSNTYTFVVRASDDACPVPAENIATIAITIVADSVVPSPNLQCVNVNANGDVDLNWDLPPDPNNSFTAWMVFSGTSPNGPFTLIDSVKNYNTTSYTHVGANAQNQQRWYYIRSRSGCDGGVLNVANDTIPTIFVNSSLGANCWNVSWNPLSSPNPSGSSNQYAVYREYPIGSGMVFYQNTSASSICEIFSNCIDSARYRVELTNSAANCVSSSNIHSAKVIHPSPLADFTSSNPCMQPVQFTDNSTTSSGTITSWNWDFGDGNSSNQQNPSHAYSGPGNYAVKLTVTNNFTCSDDTIITLSSSTPTADAGPDKSICPGMSVQIGTPAITGLNYSWTSKPNNNTINNTSLAEPTVNPGVTTIYYVNVTDANGCSNIDSVEVEVVTPFADAGVDNSICEGSSISLGGSPTGPAGATYTWDNSSGTITDPNAANPVATPLVTTTYSVTVTLGPSCTATDDVTITVFPQPTVDAGPDQEICSGGSTSIGNSSNPNGSYLWTPGNLTGKNPVVSPSTTTNYTVSYTDANNCIATDQVLVTVNPLPTVDAGSDQNICVGGSATIGGSPTGPAGSSYLWTNNVDLSTFNSANPTVSPAVTTTYTVSVTDANNCVNTDQVTVNVSSIPIADAGPDQSICEGATATIGGSPTASSGSVSWRELGSPVVISTAANPSVSPSITTSYEVEVLDGPNCTAKDTVVITVNPLPTVDAGADQAICAGSSTTIGGSPTGPAGSTYMWTNNVDASTSTSANPTVSPTVTTTYTVTVTDANNCTNSDQLTVNVTPIPVVDAGLDQTVCDGGSVTIGGSPTASAGNISWTELGSSTVFSTAANPTVSPTTNTSYVVEVVNGPNCSAKDTVVVTVDPLPTVDAGANRTLCIGSSTTLGGSPTGPAGSTYLWTNNINLVTYNTANPTVSPSVTTVYTVTVTDANSCVNTDRVTVTVAPLPVADAGFNRFICSGSSVTIGGSATGDAGSTYLWTNNIDATTYNVKNPTVSPTVTTTYTLKVTDANGCENTDQVTVFVTPIPVVDAGPDQAICSGGSVTIGGSPTANTGFVTWRIMGSSTIFSIASNPSVSPANTTSYVVEATSGPNCSARDTVVVTVNPLPTVDAGADQAICEGSSISIGGSPTGPAGSTYLWTNNIDASTSTSANPTVSPTVTTTYTVTVTDASSCVNTDQITVTVTPIPTVDAGTDQSICIGASATIGGSPTASAGSITWTELGNSTVISTVANPTVNPTTTTSYVVEVVDGPACTAKDTVVVTVNPLPTVDAGADQVICIGASATLGGSPTGPAGSTYLWTNNINSTTFNTANPTVNPTVTTVYTVTVTDANSCVSIDQVTVTVNPLPTVDAGADLAICNGSSVTIGGSPTGPAGSTYLWSNNVDASTFSTANPTVSPTVTTIYTVTVTDVNSCVNIDQVTVTVTQIPVADAGPDQVICTGATATIGGSPTASAGSISWRELGSSAVISTAANPAVSPTSTTSYEVVVVDGPSCIARDTVVVTVNPLPTVDAGADQAICAGSSISIGGSPTGPAGSTYLWTNNIDASTFTSANPTVSPNVTTIYTVTVTDVNNCIDTDFMTVTVTPIPTVDAGADQSICIGASATIGGSPTASAGSISWTELGNSTVISTAANPVVNPTTTTSYVAEVVDGPACTAKDTVVVTVNPLPTVDAGADQAICIGASATLGGSPTGPAGSTYLWTNNINSTTFNTANPTVNPTVTTVYTVTVTDANSCVSTDQVTVTVNPLPTVDAGPDHAICAGSSTNIGGSPTGPLGSTYLWTNNIDATTYSAANQIVSPMVTTTYTVTVTDVNGCVNTDAITITVHPLPLVDAGQDQSICFKDTIQIGGSPTGPAGSTFSWSPNTDINNPNSANPLVYPSVDTEYKVTVTDINGCVKIDSVYITVNPIPDVDAGPDTTICEHDSVVIGGSPTSTSAISYLWNNASTLSNANVANPKASPAVTTDYIVLVTDANGCMNSDTLTVFVEPIPVVDFAVDETCFGNITAFTDLSVVSNGSINSWQWDFGDGSGTSNLQNPGYLYADTGSYQVVLTVGSDNGCSASISKTIQIDSLPSIDISDELEICFGESVQIGDASSLPLDYTFSWFPATGLDDPAIANPVASPELTTTYYITVIDTITKCFYEDSVKVIVNQLPDVVATPDTSICVSDNVQLQATGASTYLWSPNQWLSDATSANPVASPLKNVEYVVTGTDLKGCVNTDTVKIKVFNVELQDLKLCYGDSIQVFPEIEGDTTGISYEWSPLNSMNLDHPENPWVKPLSNTRYYLTIRNGNGCMDIDSLDATVMPSPLADFELSLSPRCDFVSLEVENRSTSGNEYKWYLNNELISLEFEPFININPSGKDSIKLVVINGECSDSIAKPIPKQSLKEMLQIVQENVFTPNGDGVNDVFQIGIEGEFNYCSRLTVYNRWGEKVYDSEIIKQGWNGRNPNGEQAASGTYFYVLKIDNEIIKGSVYLSR